MQGFLLNLVAFRSFNLKNTRHDSHRITCSRVIGWKYPDSTERLASLEYEPNGRRNLILILILILTLCLLIRYREFLRSRYFYGGSNAEWFWHLYLQGAAQCSATNSGEPVLRCNREQNQSRGKSLFQSK